MSIVEKKEGYGNSENKVRMQLRLGIRFVQVVARVVVET